MYANGSEKMCVSIHMYILYGNICVYRGNEQMIKQMGQKY